MSERIRLLVDGMPWTVRVAGHGPPVLLLHGFSGSGLSWAGPRRPRRSVPGDRPGPAGPRDDGLGRDRPPAARVRRTARPSRRRRRRSATRGPAPRSSGPPTTWRGSFAASAPIDPTSSGTRWGPASPSASRSPTRRPSAGSCSRRRQRASPTRRPGPSGRPRTPSGRASPSARASRPSPPAGRPSPSWPGRRPSRHRSGPARPRFGAPTPRSGLPPRSSTPGRGRWSPSTIVSARFAPRRSSWPVPTTPPAPVPRRSPPGSPAPASRSFAGAGHAPHLEQPDRFHAIVLDFLTEPAA